MIIAIPERVAPNSSIVVPPSGTDFEEAENVQLAGESVTVGSWLLKLQLRVVAS